MGAGGSRIDEVLETIRGGLKKAGDSTEDSPSPEPEQP
jgi:hypothetical protein